MKTIHYITAYIEYIILPFIPYIIHELSHWIVAVILWMLYKNVSFPKIVIAQKAKFVYNGNGYEVHTWKMYVTYNSYVWQSKISLIAPLFTFLYFAYLAYSLGWVYVLVFLYNANTLFLSNSDIKGLQNK